MTSTASDRTPGTLTGLVRAAHAGPSVAVTVLAAALGISAGLSPGGVALVAAAVLCGQLTVGWSNDLVDRHRDRQVGRTDKPLATGVLNTRVLVLALGVAVLLTIALSLICGLLAGLIHLGCVAAAWAYNLGLKSTPLSWLPYAVAFGGLTVFVALADPVLRVGPGTDSPGWPQWWLPVAAALLGVGAHLVNALPDLADDEATGVRGLPHRLGARWASRTAVLVLVAGTAVTAVGASVPGWLLLPAVLVVAVLAGLALLTDGRTPFKAAIGIALVAAVMLVAGG